MKIRTDFVTNSSSSSFIVVYEIDDCQEFREQLRKEMGEVGIKLADKYFKKGKDYDKYSNGETELHYYIDNFDEEKTYFTSTHYTYSDDADDFDRPENFLEEYMPTEKFVKCIHKGEDC